MAAVSNEFVVDTNVVVKYFLPEADSEIARALCAAFLRGQLLLVSLDLLWLEFTNIIWLRTAGGRLDSRDAETAISEMLRFSSQMEIARASSVAAAAFKLSCALHHASYDTAFLALAENRGIPLVTADEKFYRKAQAHSRNVRLLRGLRV